VTAACSPDAWPAPLALHTRSWRASPCDAGIIQYDELRVDAQATRDALTRWNAGYSHRLDEESRHLCRSARAVLADVPPLAFDAAHAAGVPAFALANFSWDWIYDHMGFDDSARAAARSYAYAQALLALEPAAPMDAFHRSTSLGTLGRLADRERDETRRGLGVSPADRLVVIAFRDHRLCALPPPCAGVRFALPNDATPARTDIVPIPVETGFVNLVAAADAVVAKAGYGMIGDTQANGTPLLYVLRTGFPEDEVLDRWLCRRPAAHPIERVQLAAGDWHDDIVELLRRDRPSPVSQAGVEAGIDIVVSALAG
jgi:hypothetical protein